MESLVITLLPFIQKYALLRIVCRTSRSAPEWAQIIRSKLDVNDETKFTSQIQIQIQI